jgi:hypothetical protein
MTAYERANVMTLVADALESVAESAEDGGDVMSAQNATYLAFNLRGCIQTFSEESIEVAETLLEQGMSYVASVSDRLEQVGAKGAAGHILH